MGTANPQGGLSISFNNQDLINFYSPSDNTLSIQTLLDGQAISGYATYGGDVGNRLILQPLVGNVGIGTASPLAKLTVAGDTIITGVAKVGGLKFGEATVLDVGYFEDDSGTLPGNGGALTVNHNLNGIPRFYTVSIRCITAEYGWVVGDEILLNSVHMRSENSGHTVAVNTTAFKFKQLGNFAVHRWDANNIVNITTTKWRIVFRAWR